MSTASELGMVVSMHVGSSSQVPQIAPDSPFMANLAWGAIRTSGAMLVLAVQRHVHPVPGDQDRPVRGRDRLDALLPGAGRAGPGQAAVLGAARPDSSWTTPTTDVDLDTLNIRELFREHVYGCFIEDHHGIASLDEIGEDNMMCETDYPHSDSTWPNCITVVKKIIGHLPAETQYKLLRGNAEKLYRFTPAEPPVLAGA